MFALGAERRSPFQMQPLRNPFERVLPAVERFRNQVVAGVREVGTNITHRIQRSQTPPVDYSRRAQDNVQLERARATIATATPQPSLRGVSRATDEAIPNSHSAKKAIIHGIAEATKNSAPAMAVGFGARYILGTTLGVQALAVAAGASALSRGVREFVYTKRKGTFAETTKLITRHEEATVLTNFDKTERRAHTGIRVKQDEFAQTGIGKVTNAMLHGGEKRIAEFAYGKRRHARALAKYSTLDSAGSVVFDADKLRMDIAYAKNPVKLLLKLRNDAIWARMTNGTACDVYEMRQLAKGAYRAVNIELRNREIVNEKNEKILLDSAQAIHDAQLKQYKTQAIVGMGINVVGQAGLAALKAVPKTIATFFITDAFLKAIHVDTSARHSPLEGFENTRLGQFIENAIAPKSVASAEEMSANAPKAVQLLPFTSPQGESPHNWTQGLAGTRPAPPLESSHVAVTSSIEDGRIINSGSGVLSSEKITAVKPVEIPRPPSLAPVVVEVDDKNANAVARAVVNGREHLVTTQKTVTEIVHEQIGKEKTSLTQDIANKKLFPEMQNLPDPKSWFREVDSAQRMMERVLLPNANKMGPGDIPKLQAYLQENPHATFREMWLGNRDVFRDDLDKLSFGADYNVALEHVITQQEAQQVAIAEAKNAKVELADHAGWGKTPGLAKHVASTVAKPHADTISPPVNNIQPSKVDAASLFGNDSHATTVTNGVSNGVTNSGIRPSASSSASIWDSTQTPGQHVTSSSPGSVTNSGIRPSASSSASIWDSTQTPGQHVTSSSPGSVTNTGIRPSSANSAGLWDQPTNNTVDSDSYAVANSNITASKQDAAVLFENSNGNVNGSNNIQPSRVDARTLFGSDAVTTTAQTEHTSTWLDSHQAYTSTFSTTNPHFDMNGTSLPAYGLHHPDSADYNSVTAYINTLGGLNIELHSGDLDAYGVQAFEPIRNYLQGGGIVDGVAIPRLGPIQEAYRAQQLINNFTYLDIALGGRKIGGAVSAFHHVTIENEALVVPPTDLDGIIGGGPDITALIGCSRGHVQAIQMLLNAEKNAPTSLAQYFAVLRDPRAEGDSVEKAVSAIVDQWYENSAGYSEYSEFIKYYGYLDPSELTDAKYDELEGNGFFTAGRLVFDLINNGGA